MGAETRVVGSRDGRLALEGFRNPNSDIDTDSDGLSEACDARDER
jgi:hypothetical protein